MINPLVWPQKGPKVAHIGPFYQAGLYWPNAVADEADSVSSGSASACNIGGPIGVNSGELALVYGSMFYQHAVRLAIMDFSGSFLLASRTSLFLPTIFFQSLLTISKFKFY